MAENAEKTNTAPVAPAPAAAGNTTATVVEAKPGTATPESKPTLNKSDYAFVQQRKAMRELERKNKELEAKLTTPPAAAPETANPPAKTETIAHTVPAPTKTEVDIEAESTKAIEQMATDKDIAAVPGALLDIISMVDNDARLSRLHNIDPLLAFREAKSLWTSKAGIGAPPPIPNPAPVSGGINAEHTDLEALVKQAEAATPGSKEFYVLANRVDAEMKKLKRRGF